MILQKPIHTAPPHLQPMLLGMQKYDYTIHYKPSKEMVLADHLSCFPSLKESLSIPIHQNIKHVQLSTENWMYSIQYCLTLRGWPDCFKQVLRITHLSGVPRMSCPSRPVFSKDRLSLHPPKLLNCTIAELHDTHQGMKKMQAQAREGVCWPSIDAYIVNYIRKCTICTKHIASPLAQTMLPCDIPDGPWQEIRTDYLHHKGKEYLLICDLFIKYTFLFKVNSKSALSLSQKL